MLTTIGYEGAQLKDFLATLGVAKIDLLIDVRERAQSRRPGFSKTALEKALDSVGIQYLHLRDLGDPAEGREAARSGDFTRFRQIYARVLKTEAAQHALKIVIEESSKRIVCLLCYERDVMECHRKIVADLVQTKTGTKARHLGVKQFEQAA